MKPFAVRRSASIWRRARVGDASGRRSAPRRWAARRGEGCPGRCQGEASARGGRSLNSPCLREEAVSITLSVLPLVGDATAPVSNLDAQYSQNRPVLPRVGREVDLDSLRQRAVQRSGGSGSLRSPAADGLPSLWTAAHSRYSLVQRAFRSRQPYHIPSDPDAAARHRSRDHSLSGERAGCQFDDWRDEEPGKILHEVRLGRDGPDWERFLTSPTTGRSMPRPLFLVLLSELVKWTGDWKFVEELRGPHVQRR